MVAPQVYEFGPYRLELPTHRLLRGGTPVPLTPKAFDVLVALLERRDRVVDKTELIQLVWPDSFVEDANLSQTIFVLRKMLGKDSDGCHFIETVPRRGYRFAAHVRAAHPPADTGVAPTNTVRETASARDSASSRFRWVAVSAVGVLLIVGAEFWYRGVAPGASASNKVMLAVLPFDNLSGDPEQEYFSNGLTEETITQLGALEPERLGVIARTSAMQYKGGRKDVRLVGRELGVDYILEGSVRRDGRRVRITAQLVQASDQTHLWAADYDRDLRDMLGVQSEVASAIAQQIRLTLTPEQDARLHRAATVNPDAFEDYLLGRFFWNKRTVEGHQQAIAFFDKAIALDPQYAKAYAGLADAYALLGSAANDVLPRAEAMSRARDAAQKALALDNSLADAHTSLGFVKMHYDWDFHAAEQEFLRAIALNPTYATAHHWYAYDLVALGRLDEAVAAVRRAQSADPLSVIISRDVGELLLFAGRNEEAIAQLRKTLEMDPHFELAHWTLAWGYERTGPEQAFLDELRRAGTSAGSNAPGQLYVRTGRKPEARRLLEQMEAHTPERFGLFVQIAEVAVALGEKDRAYAALENALRERDGGLIIMRVDPPFRPIWSDPRF